MSNDPVICQLRYFRNIAGYNGVLICGVSPHWVFLTSRGEFRAHPMHIDGPIPCFAPFHNVNCSQGFLYFNNKVGIFFASIRNFNCFCVYSLNCGFVSCQPTFPTTHRGRAGRFLSGALLILWHTISRAKHTVLSRVLRSHRAKYSGSMERTRFDTDSIAVLFFSQCFSFIGVNC